MYIYEIGPVYCNQGLIRLESHPDRNELSNFVVKALYEIFKYCNHWEFDFPMIYLGALPYNGNDKTLKFLLFQQGIKGAGFVASEFPMNYMKDNLMKNPVERNIKDFDNFIDIICILLSYHLTPSKKAENILDFINKNL